MRVTKHAAFAQDLSNLGYQERLRQIELVRSGSPSFMVMCEPNPAKLPERKILDFNREEVFRGGELIELEGDSWLEFGERVVAKDIRA